MAVSDRSDVLTLFDAFEALASQAVALRSEGKAQKKQTQETFLRQWDDVLAKFLQYRNAGFEPARIFYQRMADSQTVLGDDRLGEYVGALELYRTVAGKKRSSDLLGMAVALLSYCATHRLDPDNSLVGLSPSSRALQSCAEEERSAKKRSGMAEGDLLLVELPGVSEATEARWRYARVARAASEGEDLVAVYMLPEEKSREEVAVRSVRALSQWILQNLGHAKSMQRLVCDPFETFVQRLQDDVKSATHSFLTNQHLDVELLEDVVNNPNEAPPLSVLPRLRQLIAGLLTLNSRLDLLSAFYDDVNAAADRKIEAFLADIGNQRVFLPMKAANLTHLETFNFSSFATNRIRMCYGRCDACMDTMKLALKDLTNGQAKQRLTKWWLEKIEAETTAFLRSKKYAFDAYPSEYLQAPPENIQPVKFNLQLIREILNPLDDKHGTQELVARLKGDIYPRIDEFILSALVALNQVLPTIPTQTAAPDVPQLEAFVAVAAPKLEPDRVQWMTELVKDLKYLARMRQLETSGERVLDVVPISGLVLSQFYRLENELKTVIELWDGFLQEQAQMKGEKTYQRLKTKIYLWKITDANRIDVMKEFGGTSCIMQIETGGFFSAALTEHGEVYAWGKGLSGELGIGEKRQSDEPVQVEALKGKKVIQISCGGAACAAVTSDGELFLWGFFVVLGAPLLTPTLIDAAQFNHVRIRAVSLGPQHMLVLLDSGELYVWGKGNRGQLGLGQLKDRDKPSLLEGELRLRKIKRVRAGEDISAAVTEAGELYVWGKNDDQLLGIDSFERSVDRPARLSQLSGRVVDLAVGSRHLVALTEAGEVYTWGSSLRPALIDNLPSRPLMIACGQQHAVVCTETDVLTWRFARSTTTSDDGLGSQRKANVSEKKSHRAPDPAKLLPKPELEVIEELRGKHVLQVACGSQHTTVLVENPAFFGVPLATVMEREKGRRVPSMVQKICAYLLNRIATEGLFRFAGRAAQVQELRSDFDRDEDVNLFRCRDPHTVTSLLKDYLRLLPEPLIPYDHVDDFLSLGEPTPSSAPSHAAETSKFLALCQLVHTLPTSHRDLLEYLLVFWNKVACRANENKMNAQALAIALAPVVFRRKEGGPTIMTRETTILAANSVLRSLITLGSAYANETPESLAQQAQMWTTNPQGRADAWQLWTLRISKEGALAAASGFFGTLLSSSALDAALTSAVLHDIDATEAQALNSLCLGLLRYADGTAFPNHLEALEVKAREAQTRVASVRNVSEDRLEEFVAEEAKRARNTAALVTARITLLHALSTHASQLRALVQWTQSSPALSAFRGHRWPLESGWRLLEAAGAEIAPLLLRGFDITDVADIASSREGEEALITMAAAEALVDLRRTQLSQLSFARKKLQSAQQAGNAAVVQSLHSKFVMMYDAFLSPDTAPTPGVLLAPLLSASLPAGLEQRRAALLTASAKLEIAVSDMKKRAQ